MNFIVRFVFSIGLGLVAIGGTAEADLAFSFQFDQSNYTATAGGTVDVQVHLRQVGTTGSGQFDALGGPGAVGLTGTGVQVTFPTGPNDAQVLTTSNIAGNAAFDNFGFLAFTKVGSGSALLSQSTSGAPVFGTSIAPNTYDLLLGTFSFTAGTVPGQVTRIATSLPLFPNTNDNVAATSPLPTVLTNIANSGATITVRGGVMMATPEPGTLTHGIIGLVLGSGLILWRGRRAVRGPSAEVPRST